MADLMRALRNAHEAGDTEAATRIAGMIKAQQQGAAQAAPQPQQAPVNPTTQPQTTEATTEPQSALERAFDYAGNVAASGGRMIAGGVSDLANVGVGAANAVLSAADWATGDDTINYRLPKAGYGEADKYLQPQSTGEKIVAGAVPYIVGGEVAAPLKAAEGAGRLVRAGTSIINQAPGAIAGALSENNQGDNAGDLAASVALNSVLPGAVEKVGGSVVKSVRSILPESLGGISQASKAADVANPDYLAKVLQGGDEQAQQAFRTATTNEAGESILNPSQVLNAQGGKKFIAAEQRDLNRGANSEYAQRLQEQQTGAGLQRAINEVNPAQGGTLQDAAQQVNTAFKEQSQKLYNESKKAAQDILDNGPVKITELKLPETKSVAQAHLNDSAASGNIKLTPDARRTLTQFNKADIKSIDDLDMWKRQLNEKAQKAYRSGDFTSYNALRDTSSGLKTEADNLLTAIHPQAGSLYRDADNFYSQSVGDFGDKSIIGKIADTANPDTAANALIRGQNAEFNTQQVVTALQDAINRGDIQNAQALAQQLGGGLGSTVRNEALARATTGENFSPTKFANTLNQLEPQSQAASALTGGNDAQINSALADSIRAIRDRAAVPTTNNLVAQAAGRATGGTVGAMMGGGPIGAVVGQEVGGRITSAINQGLLDRLAGTTKRGNEYVNYLSDPANAKAVSDILAQRGASFDNATAKEVATIIKGLTSSTASNALLATPEERELPVNLPKAPEPAQKAQAAKAPEVTAADIPDKYLDAKRFYKSIAEAETGGLGNRFIRTKAAEAGPSSAYGPAQLTVTLADDFRKRHSDIFTKSELAYLDRFSEQGKAMLHADPSDPVYGYGGAGVLGDKADQKLYARVVVKMLHQMREENNGSYDKTLSKWRGADDSKYFAKVRNAMQETKRSGWGNGKQSRNLFNDDI
ncbi:hypothetical protein GHH61_23585 [Salmonella enterica]|nr:hypothetical protein [Salmonella enterica]